MKHLLFIGEKITSEPIQELGGRTVLEVAKTPTLTRLAKEGSVGLVTTVPKTVEFLSVTACLSLLGFDPAEHYTGLAPLEAAAFEIAQDDREVMFRCDLVSVLDEVLMDPTAGNISNRESRILLAVLREKFSGEKVRFFEGRGYKNFISIRDMENIEDLDDLTCFSPQFSQGQNISKGMPRGRSSKIVADLMHQSQAVLQGHEINRVRIDLGENPANLLWLWAQGKKPRLESWGKKYGMEGVFFSDSDAVTGLAKLLGLRRLERATVEGDEEFFLFYFEAGQNCLGMDLKTQIKHVEEFDAFVGAALNDFSGGEGARVAVVSDAGPFLWWGDGVRSEFHGGFHEKACAESKRLLAPGHDFLKLWFNRS